jgi:hypothetical protein
MILWQAHCDAEYNKDWGFEAYWRDHPEIGSPMTVHEGKLTDGRAVRVFANGVYVYGDNGVERLT